jgi:acyl-CoA synthetase (AMP-forming)/AMP-acid ligase II
MSDVVDAGDGLPLTVPALLAARAEARGDRPMIICDDVTLTYAEADRESARLAKGLVARGASRGSRVGILHPNGPPFVTAWLAAARIGALSFPYSTFSPATELRWLLLNSQVEILFAAGGYRSHDYVALVNEAVPDLDLSDEGPLFSPTVPTLRRVAFRHVNQSIPASWTHDGLVEAGESISDEVLAAMGEEVSASDRMVVIHTSGSTSDPKAVIHPHGSLIRHMANLNQIRRYTEDEIYFSNSPFFWIGGFAYVMLATLVAGATLVCSNSPEAAGVLDLLESTKPTMVSGFAASVAHLPKDPSFAGRDLGSIRRGNLWPILPAAIRPRDPELRHNLLGMTETGSTCLLSGDETDQPEHRRGSFGKPAPGFEAKVVDPETRKQCQPGEPGELWFRGWFMMEGYLGRERHETFEPDRWYRTGDIFVVDADGFFYFKGRRGDMIKTAGANVSPREVEAAIRDVTGLVSHVTGIDDEDRGQLVAAAVRIPPGQAPPDIDELRSALRSQLSAFKIPKKVILLPDDEVPMMSSGKLDMRALKRMLADA